MTPLFDFPLGRRSLLFGAAPALVLAATAPGAAFGAMRVDGFDLEDPRDNLNAYMKMTYSVKDGELTMGWFGGHVLALVDNEPLTPLMRIEGFGVGTSKRNADGSYNTLWKEVGYYKDLRTDAVLGDWLNPLTGKTNQVLPIHNLGVNAHLDVSFSAMKGGPPGMTESRIQYGNYSRVGDPASPFVLPWSRVGDTTNVWLDVSAVLPNPLPPETWPMESSGKTIRIAEQFLYTGKTADLLNPARSSVDYTGSWNRVSPWLPWMEMGSHRGGLMIRAATKRLRGYDELPRALRDYTARHYPEYLNPVVDPSHKNESSWEVFKRERRPQPVS